MNGSQWGQGEMIHFHERNAHLIRHMVMFSGFGAISFWGTFGKKKITVEQWS